MQKHLISFLIVIFIAVVGEIIAITPAHAVTVKFQWTGNTGYLAKGSFNYDEETTPVIISEQGDGNTKILQSFTISFYNPTGKRIATYDDVVNGVSMAHYFQFNFNTVTRQIEGAIDLGGEVSDEMYLKGTVDDNLSLFKVAKSGKEEMLDQDSGSFMAFSKRSPA